MMIMVMIMMMIIMTIMMIIMIMMIITYMKKLLDSDWLRAVQLKRNTSAKSVIPVQKA